MSNPVVHFEIGSRQSEKAKAFYASLFGWKISSQGPAEIIDTVSRDGIQGNIAVAEHDPYVTVYIAVPDIDATLANVKKLGGKTLVPRTEIPGMGQFAWFADIDGNALGLWKQSA